jgi:hypothetical protein
MGHHRAHINYFLIVALLAVIPLGCLGKEDVAAKKAGASVGLFESGRIDHAIEVASEVRENDRELSEFLVFQYMLYSALGHGQGVTSIHDYAGRMKDVSIDRTSGYQAEMISAKVFASLSILTGEAALSILQRECAGWGRPDIDGCVNHLVEDAMGRYYSTHEKMAAVYLYESSTVLERVAPSKSQAVKYFQSLALVEINNASAGYSIRSMLSLGQFNNVMAQQYCQFIKATRHEQFIDCDRISVIGGDQAR